MKPVAKPSMKPYDHWVLVCVGPNCTEHGEGQELYDLLKSKLKQRGLIDGDIKIHRSRVNCFGVCSAGPLLSVQPDGVWYYAVNSEMLDTIIEQHLIAGKPIKDWIFHQGPVCKIQEKETNKDGFNCYNL